MPYLIVGVIGDKYLFAEFVCKGGEVLPKLFGKAMAKLIQNIQKDAPT